MADGQFLRARRAGDMKKLVCKMEDRYDEEDYLGTPDALVTWINEVLKGEHQNLDGKANGWRKINHWLRDGVAICKLINKLLAHDGKSPIKYKASADTAFLALDNIETFNKACVEYGLPITQSFQSADLYEYNKGLFLNVINTLNFLGFESVRRGFLPQYIPPAN